MSDIQPYLNDAVADYWSRYYCPHGFCALCGNSGVLDTRGVHTAVGVPCGDVLHCICPNGQKLRSLGYPAMQAVVRNERYARYTI